MGMLWLDSHRRARYTTTLILCLRSRWDTRLWVPVLLEIVSSKAYNTAQRCVLQVSFPVIHYCHSIKERKHTSVHWSHLPCEMIMQSPVRIGQHWTKSLLAKLPLLNRNASPEIVFPNCESIFETPCHPRRCQKCKLKSLQSSASLSLIMTFFSSNTITYDVYPCPPFNKKKIKKPP